MLEKDTGQEILLKKEGGQEQAYQFLRYDRGEGGVETGNTLQFRERSEKGTRRKKEGERLQERKKKGLSKTFKERKRRRGKSMPIRITIGDCGWEERESSNVKYRVGRMTNERKSPRKGKKRERNTK